MYYYVGDKSTVKNTTVKGVIMSLYKLIFSNSFIYSINLCYSMKEEKKSNGEQNRF